MILLFKNRDSGFFEFVGVGKGGIVSLASKATNYVFIPLSDFDKLLKKPAFEVVKQMNDKFNLLEGDAKVQAIKDEMSLQSDFIKEVSVFDYKKFMRSKKC